MGSPQRTPISDPPGTRIADRYRVVAALGRGGMGRVYRAVDETTGKRIALKRATFPKDREAKLSVLFEREYQTLALLDHPCIIRVLDFGRDDRGPYYTMELLEGQDLRELSPLPYGDACRYLRDVASSLALLHARRLVHRDVSPGNVRIGGDDHAKLIDFGALSSFGPNKDVIGTPPCVPPEAVRGQPLDQRSDLFAFGAVLYYALTGRHAYPSRDIPSLHTVWLVAPQPPSAIVAGIPEALDELVLSLLSLDPVARPHSAAVVIDQLTVIAELETDGEHQLAEAYLRSAALVGRERELRRLGKRLDALADGGTHVMLLTGGSGIGKTRLLSELGLRARLANVKVIHAAAESHREPYGVARKLALDLIEVAPEVATRCGEAHVAVLGHVVPELRERLPAVPLERLPSAGPERRARLQRALAEWLSDVTKAQPIVLTVDNIELADESSMACIASLARGDDAASSLLIALTMDPAHVRAAAIAQQLPRDAASKISSLTAEEVEELVRSLFGDVPHVPQFARVLRDASSGNPAHCLQLARHLIRSGHVQYSGGAWLLPQELSCDDLPSGIEDVLLARLHKMEPSTRELAKQLCVSRLGMSLPLIVRLSGGTEAHTLRALDELVAAELVVNDEAVYRFGVAALRERLLHDLEVEPKKSAHRALAIALHESAADDGAAQLESGFHLLQSGAALEGARRMAQAANKIADENNYAREILDAMEVALAVLESHGAPEIECLLLRAQLVVGAFRTDHRIATKYGPETMARLQRYLGYSFATRLSAVLGDRIALRIGIAYAAARHLVRRRPGAELRLAYRTAFFAWLSLLGVAAICLDRERLDQLIAPMRVILGFGPRSFPAFAFTMAERMRAQTYGQEVVAERLSLKALDTLRDERVGGQMSRAAESSYRGGILFGLGLMQVFRADDSALRTAQSLNALGFAMYEVVSAQISLIAHAYRGETLIAQSFQKQVETLALRGGSTWQTEIFILVNMLVAHSITGDVVALKQSHQQLARLSAEIPTLSGFTALANALIQLYRGRHAEALTTFEMIRSEFAPRQRNGWAMVRAGYAHALMASGQAQRAEAVCAETIALLDDGDREFPLLYVHIERSYAHAKSVLGKHAEARAQIGELIKRFAHSDIAVLLGLLHRDAAEIALAASDASELAKHIERARHFFRLTTNAQLIASVERVAKRGERAQARAIRSSISAGPRTDAFLQTLLACTDHEQRAATALSALVESTEAAAGFLVLFADGAPYVAASLNAEPPDSLMTASSALRDGESKSVTASVVSASSSATEDDSAQPTAMQIAINSEPVSLHPFLLSVDESRGEDLVGVVWLAQRAGKTFVVDRSLFDAAAQALRVL